MTIASLRLSPNIQTLEWAPQNDILGHPSVKAFVMQAGINSLYEAAYHGKPVISVPLVTDQVDNAAKVRLYCSYALLPHSRLGEQYWTGVRMMGTTMLLHNAQSWSANASA